MGPPTTSSARSTTSMARSTPAQKPRGPARTISSRPGRDPDGADMLISLGSGAAPQYRERPPATQAAQARSSEVVAHAEHEEARVDAEVLVAPAGVRDVLEAIPGRDRHPVGDEPGQPRPALDDEVHVAVRLAEVHLPAQDAEPELEVGPHHPPGTEDPAPERREPPHGGRLRLGVEVDEGRLGDQLDVPTDPPGAVLVGKEDAEVREE